MSLSLSLYLSEPVMLPEDVELKQEIVMMSPPASDSGSGSPHQFSPYCVDSEPGSPLLEHDQVKHKGRITHILNGLFCCLSIGHICCCVLWCVFFPLHPHDRG